MATTDQISDLGVSGRDLWDGVRLVREVPKHMEPLLLNACRIVDRLDEMADRLAVDPLTVKLYDKQGQEINEVANPLLIEHRQQTATLSQIMARLGLEKLATKPSGDKKTIAQALAEARKANEGKK